jgi:hypothetical protein
MAYYFTSKDIINNYGFIANSSLSMAHDYACQVLILVGFNILFVIPKLFKFILEMPPIFLEKIN